MLRALRTILILLLAASATRNAQAQTTWYVDDDCSAPGAGTEEQPFCTIQDGVNASSDGDTVLVGPGTYTGDGNRDISLFGKTIILKSSDGPDATTIDVEGNPQSIHRGFFLDHGEPRETLIEGFTITGGNLIGDTGGSGPAGGGGGAGIYLGASSPTIRDCAVVGNISRTVWNPFVHDGRGGGVLLDRESSALIENCMIIGNEADRQGGGMLHIGGERTAAAVRNSLFAFNCAEKGGGIHNAAPDFVGNIIYYDNNVIVNNFASFSGGGFNNGHSHGIVRNTIIWGNNSNLGAQIYVTGALFTIEYSLLEGGARSIGGSGDFQWGPGSIDADPLFVHPENGNFHLLPGSPCIDAGNNLAVPEGVETDLDGGPRFLDDPNTPDTGNPDPDQPKLPIVDMGPYEFDPDDCNNNGVPDEEDLKSGESSDIDENGIPDDCQLDCNRNGIPDSYEISEGLTEDCDANGVPDECDPDCNENDQPDACDIADGISTDCDANGVPDECPGELPGPPITQQPVSQEVAVGELAFFQVEADGVVLEYQWRKDSVDLIDTERILGSQSPLLVIFDVVPEDAGDYDCVVTELFDFSCTTSDAATLTVTAPCPADINDDGVVGPVDLAMLLGAWGPCADPDACPADLNADTTVDPIDLATLLAAWGPCP